MTLPWFHSVAYVTLPASLYPTTCPALLMPYASFKTARATGVPVIAVDLGYADVQRNSDRSARSRVSMSSWKSATHGWWLRSLDQARVKRSLFTSASTGLITRSSR